MARTYTRRADRMPTWTSKTVAALKAADDFMTAPMLCAATGATTNQIHATLHHLKVRAKAVDCLVSEGQLWFFLTGEDVRTKVVEERVPEPKGNRTRKKARPKETK